ncbi:AhpD family alkylhydroperoxidase [Geomicrobium halophilum]|uniref:AhpD family alkylhydroperoxidase n=1 Tax=Geomicrobium halophilum TaxID=549000 RepID=A0A841PZN8_9BACL|nr:carboxymuconolactone decarboxylase family protein [Geomicrobium halophilum]MBB6450252.1 AhpD family alkylhydroperoxidase [Geomicrobium halophilum]
MSQNDAFIEEALQEYEDGMGYFSEQLPKVARKYHAFTDACFAQGEISKKNKQLIALGISLSTNEEYCIIDHTKGCLDEGCSEAEIMEAVAVSAAFGGGAALSQAVTIVRDTIETFDSATSS